MNSLLSCPLIEDHPYDVYLYQLPIFSLLILNTIFMVVIMKAVVAKLKSTLAGQVWCSPLPLVVRFIILLATVLCC